MKKVLSLILVLVMCLSLCGCFYFNKYKEPTTSYKYKELKTCCQNCKNDISYDAAFCEYCGASQNDEQPTTPFEPLSFSGTGNKSFRDINIPYGNYVLIGNATISGAEGTWFQGAFNVSLKNSRGNLGPWWVESLYPSRTTTEKMEPFQGPINGGVLEISANDDISWTITIEAAN